MADRSSRTEQPTERRLKKAREEGQYPQARELIAAAQFAIFLLLLGAGGPRWVETYRATVRSLLGLAFAPELRPQDLTHAAWQLFWRHCFPLLAAGMGVAAATLGLRLVTTGFGLSLKKVAPDPARLNPLSRLRELPRQNLSSLLQAVVLLPVFLWAVWAIAREQLDAFLALPMAGVESGFALVASAVQRLFWRAAGVFLIFGAVDFFRQIRRHRQDLRMSRQEIKDEIKELEGNLQMKARIRRLQRDRARRQMMKEVPKATAVIVNPTHYAVALRYQMEGGGAPSVTAKGKNYLAKRIRQKAVENQVPIVENPPLAQALYRSVEVGQEIPPHLYRAVAEILAYIFKLMHGRLPG
jgi:flagellar biosynthetic protein FlhB